MSSEDADNSDDDDAQNLGNTNTTTGLNANKDISPAVKRLYQHHHQEPQATQLDDFYMSIENPVASPSSSSTSSGNGGDEGRENRAHLTSNKDSIFEHGSQVNPSRPQTQSILASKTSSSSSSSSSSALFPELNHPCLGLPNIVALTPILNTLHPQAGLISALREGEAYTFTQPPDLSAMELGASLLLSQSSLGGGMLLSPRSHSPLLSDRGVNPQASPLASGDKPDGFETELRQSQQPQSQVQSAKPTVSFSQTSVTRHAYTQAEPALDTSNLHSNDTSVDLGPAATTVTVASVVSDGVVENEVTDSTSSHALIGNEVHPTTVSKREVEASTISQPEKVVEVEDEQHQVQPAILTDDMYVITPPITAAATDAILLPVDQPDEPGQSQPLTTLIAPTTPTMAPAATTTAPTAVTPHTANKDDPPGAFETWDDEPTDKPVAETRNSLVTIDSTNKQHKRFTDADDDSVDNDVGNNGDDNSKDTNMLVEPECDEEDDEGVAAADYDNKQDEDPHPDTDPPTPIHKPLAIAHSQPLPRRRTSYLAETCYSHSQDDSQHLYLKHGDRMFTIGASGMWPPTLVFTSHNLYYYSVLKLCFYTRIPLYFTIDENKHPGVNTDVPASLEIPLPGHTHDAHTGLHSATGKQGSLFQPSQALSSQHTYPHQTHTAPAAIPTAAATNNNHIEPLHVYSQQGTGVKFTSSTLATDPDPQSSLELTTGGGDLALN